MILINAQNLSKSFTSRPLFEGLSFSIERGDRIGLIGPNGAGKSTLLQVLSGKISPDEGRLSPSKGLRVGFMEQVPRFLPEATIQSTILETSKDPHDWEELVKAEEIISKMDLSQFGNDHLVSQLSGGWKKRVALGRELLRDPDLLLLDEPTNHLDVESILWLEDFLSKSNFATLTITHDRLFLQKIANRIIEVDRRHPNGLLTVKGDYASYLVAREEILAAQELHETKLKNTLRRETEWLRRGAKARQTKQQARIDATLELRETVSELSDRNRNDKVRFDFVGSEKNPKKLIEAKNISKSYDGKVIVPPIDLLITPKSRIGLMGKNGCGKSTLIKLLTKTESSDTGTVTHAERLKVIYFEQNRESLNPNHTILETISPHGDYVDYGTQKVHVKSYLTRFLFKYEQMDMEVRKLSGGEQSRLLLAKLMLNEANVLVLDEPTNDLDMSTLDVLAEVLQEFQGAIILVTHDRYFLDQMTSQILAFGIDPKGKKQIFSMSGLEQWEIWHDEQLKLQAELEKKKSTATVSEDKPVASEKKRKLSFKEQRELDSMESTIKKAEDKLTALTEELSSSSQVKNPQRFKEINLEMSSLQSEIERLYARWAELDN